MRYYQRSIWYERTKYLLESWESPLKCCCKLFDWDCGGWGSNINNGGVI